METHISSFCSPLNAPNTQQTNATCNTHPYVHVNTPKYLHLIQDMKIHIKKIKEKDATNIIFLSGNFSKRHTPFRKT